MLRLKNIFVTVNGSNGVDREILRDISIEFKSGRLYAITGPNGGGKTSIAKVIMGIYKPNRGEIYLNGEEISNLNVCERARRGISYAFQHPPRFKGITVGDLIQIASPDIDSFNLRAALRNVGLCPEDYLERDVGPGLSGGEIKRIEIAQVLARNARISILDEPEAGVDLWTMQKLIGIIVEKYKNNPDITTIIITHNQRVLEISDEIIVLEDGVIKASGAPHKIWPLIKDDIECKMKEQCRGEMAYEL
ncbi:MAG: ATP-binding cassette domain-containing protein [Syntrophomonadaceae bacterium]|nr:ATP-binding cassette domain-containing protein [Syntrophomonadaceae bacterium]